MSFVFYNASPSHHGRGLFHFILLLWICACILFFSTSSLVQGLQYTILPGEIFTIEDSIYPGHMLTFQFEFPDESTPLPIVVKVDGENHKSWESSKSGLTTVVLPEVQQDPDMEKAKQIMVVAIDNSHSHFTSVPVNFYFRTTFDFSHVGSEDLLDPLENKVRTLGMSLQRLEAFQVSLKTEQKNHRATVESTNRRVLLWSIYQVVALFFMSFINFLFFKRFLEKKTFF